MHDDFGGRDLFMEVEFPSPDVDVDSEKHRRRKRVSGSSTSRDISWVQNYPESLQAPNMYWGRTGSDRPCMTRIALPCDLLEQVDAAVQCTGL